MYLRLILLGHKKAFIQSAKSPNILSLYSSVYKGLKFDKLIFFTIFWTYRVVIKVINRINIDELFINVR